MSISTRPSIDISRRWRRFANGGIASVAVLTLAACGQPEAAMLADTGSTTDPVAVRMAMGTALTPGLYRTVQTGDVETESTHCVTAQQIAGSQFAGAETLPEGWTATRNRMTGGVIDVEAIGPSDATMTIRGTHGARQFEVHSLLVFTSGGETHRMANKISGVFEAATCPPEEVGEAS